MFKEVLKLSDCSQRKIGYISCKFNEHNFYNPYNLC